MWWTVLFLMAAFLCFSTVNGSSSSLSPSGMHQNITCYNSSDPAALNASQLYDKPSDTGNFWKRDDLQKPLPPCSAIIDALSNGTCEVCRGEQVFAVCQGLSESVAMWMEGSSKGIEKGIEISTYECDQLIQKAKTPTTAPTPAPTTAATTQTPGGHVLYWLLATAGLIIIIIIIIIIIVGYQWRKRRSEDKQDPEAVPMKPLNGGHPTDVVTVDEIPNRRG